MQSREQPRIGSRSVKKVSLVLPTNLSKLFPTDTLEVFGPLGINPELICEFVLYNWNEIDATYQTASPVMNNFSEIVDLMLQESECDVAGVDIDAYYQSNTPEFFSEFLRIKNALKPFLGDIPSGIQEGEVQQMNVSSAVFANDNSPAVVDIYVNEV